MLYSHTQIKILSKLSELNQGQYMDERPLMAFISTSEKTYYEAVSDLQSRGLIKATNWRLLIKAEGRKALRDYYLEEIFLFLKSKPCDEPFYWININELFPTITNDLAMDIKDDLKFKGFLLHNDATDEGEIVTVTEKLKAYLRGDKTEPITSVYYEDKSIHTHGDYSPISTENSKQKNYFSGGDLKMEANKISNANTANANSPKSFWRKISDWIVSNIVKTILVSLLVAYIVYRLGWNK